MFIRARTETEDTLIKKLEEKKKEDAEMKYERLVEIFDDYKRYFKNLDGVSFNEE